MANGQPQPQEDKRFDILRQKVRSRALKTGQQAGEAVRRRFAALGGLQTGAAIKTEQLAQQEAQKVGEERMGDIDIAEATERQRQREIEEQREFQRGEAALTRGFQKEVFEFEKLSKLRQLGLAERELTLNEDIAKFNKQISLSELGRPTDIFASLLGPEFSLSRLF